MRCWLGMICVGLLFSVAVSAQQKKQWYLLPQAGLLNGDGVVSGQAMLSGGITRKGWDIGLGVGVDYYEIRTVPLFADLRKNIGTLPLFVYANIGYNFATPLESQYIHAGEGWNHSRSSFSNGWYAESGLGYDIPLKKNNRFLLAVGYSVKTAGEKYTETIPRDFPPYVGEVNERSYQYQFNRFVLKLGFRL
jgi:hypothetical protein